MMRILHTAHSYPPEVSGVSEVVGQISVRLARRGHEVHVATSRPRLTPQEEVLNGVYVHRFSLKGNAVTGIQGDIDAFLHFVQSESWDVLAMHCAQTWTTDALLPYLDHISAGKVFVGHGFSTLNAVKYNDYFTGLAESLRQVDKIVALSDLLEEVPFCTAHGLPKPQIIPNGVDLIEWGAPTLGLRETWGIGKRPWLLSVSNHSPVKGHATFFEVVRRVRQQFPGVVGTIIGGHYPAAKCGLGRFGIKGGCWYRCRLAAGLTTGVTLRWDVLRRDVVSAVQEADIVLVTSWREASPLVILESMAAGTPWVSFDVGCVREHVGGVVVRSPQEMVDTVVELLGDPNRRRRLGQDGQARVAEKHDWESVATQYEQLYETVQSGGNNANFGYRFFGSYRQ